jgi:hypothetical protein
LFTSLRPIRNEVAMRLRVKILDGSGAEKKELVIEVPSNITVEGIIETLRKKRPELFDAKEYTANFELPTSKRLVIDEDALVIIRPRGWDFDVRILEG